MEKIEVKHETLFKNKWQMVIYILLFGILIYLFIYIGTKDYTTDVADNERFAKEYSLVSSDNVFEYINVVDAHIIAGGKKGIVFFGNSSNEWANYYANILNNAAKSAGIEKIYYYDFYKDREQNNATYEDLLKILDDYVYYNDEGKAEIYAPTLLVVSNNKVLLFDTETNFNVGNISPSEYWTEFQKNMKTNELNQVFEAYLK